MNLLPRFSLLRTSCAHGKARRAFHSSRICDRHLRSLIMGSPGAGKGTQTKRLTQKYDIQTISSGDLLRRAILDETPLGLQAQTIIEDGGLVPDDLVVELILTELDKMKHKNWMLDGFPRTLSQAKILDAHLEQHGQPLDLVINLDVPEKAHHWYDPYPAVSFGFLAVVNPSSMNCASDRWIHPSSGRTYNMSYNPPERTGFDDVTGEPLAKRPDDNVETFKYRLDKYHELTRPLLDYYGVRGTIRSFHGETSDQIYPQIEEELDKWFT